MKKRLMSLLLCGTLAATVLAGCGGGGSSAASTAAGKEESKTSILETAENVNAEIESGKEDAKYKDAIVIATTNDLPSNAPYGSNNTQTAMLTNSTFNRLVRISKDNEILPDLATSWSGNEDSTVWTFKLRDDVTFQNGRPLVAEDVIFTFEYASSTTNEGITFPINGTEHIASMEAPDEHTVVFQLTDTCADWPYYAAQKIMSRATVEEEGIEKGGSIGTGPYKFVSYEPGVQWVMERNDNYFGEVPVTRQITFTVITDDNARALSIESGDVDVVFDPNPADIVKFLNNPAYNVYQNTSLSNVFLGINCAREGGNLDIRRALAMAISRDDIEAACYEDGQLGTASFNYVNSASPLHAEVNAIPYDPEGAIEILKELGYDANNKLQLRLCAAGKFIPLAEIIQANLAAVNIDLTVSEFSQAGFSSSLREDGKYDMYLQQSSSQGSILNIVQRFFATGGQSNVMNYSNPELDAMMEEATKSKDMDEMAERYAEIQQVLADEVPAIPLIEQYLWCIGTKDFYGVDLNNQYYYVDFTNCVVLEE